MSKGSEKLPYERVLSELIYLISRLEEIRNSSWLSNAYITIMKESFS